MQIKVGHKKIGENCPVFVIAELGINHNGNLKIAKKMIDVAKEAGADCVKFQTFKAEELVADPNLKYTYKSQGKKVTESQLAMFKRYEFSKKEWKEIIGYCKRKKVIFSTTAQNPSDLDFILSLTDMPFIKVGSDDLTNLGLMEYYAKKKKPMIISAGMAYESEIKDAISVCRKAGNKKIIVLHCVSSYPAEADEVNLKKIPEISKKFNVETGFSDHTIGSAAAVGAVCMGAKVIEKHFTLSHELKGPDHWFSITADELKLYVKDIRFIEEALGNSALIPTKKEIGMRRIARRSIVALNNIRKGERINLPDLVCKRPGTGLAPRFMGKVIGKFAKQNIKSGELITFKKIK